MLIVRYRRRGLWVQRGEDADGWHIVLPLQMVRTAVCLSWGRGRGAERTFSQDTMSLFYRS